MYFIIAELSDQSITDVLSVLSTGVALYNITKKKFYINRPIHYQFESLLTKIKNVANTVYCTYLDENSINNTNLLKIKKNIRLHGTFHNIQSFYSPYKSNIIDILPFDELQLSESNLNRLEKYFYVYVDNKFDQYIDKYQLLSNTMNSEFFVILDSKNPDILKRAKTLFSNSSITVLDSLTDLEKLYMMINCKKGGFYIENSLSSWGIFLNTVSSFSINIANFPNTNYWNDFYKKNNMFTLEASTFCKFVLEYLNDYPEHKSLLDLGCGNGRDLLHFHEKELQATGIDLSSEICNFLKKNTSLSIINDSFVTCDYPEHDIYYSRFTLHAIDYSLVEEFIKNISLKMNENSLLFIETRSIIGTKYENKDYIEYNFISGIGELHKRTLFKKKYLTSLLGKYNLFAEYETEEKGLSPYKGEDPYLIRLVLKKVNVQQLLQKMITPSLLERQYLLKEAFEHIIFKLEQNNINYVIFFGNLIGLVRHNNLFVPWDDDVDILVDKKDIDLINSIFKDEYTITDVKDHLILYNPSTNMSFDFFYNCNGVNNFIGLNQYTYINGYRVPLDYEKAFYNFYSGISASEIMNTCVIYNHHYYDRWSSKHMVKVKKDIQTVTSLLEELPNSSTDEYRIIYKLVQAFTKKR